MESIRDTVLEIFEICRETPGKAYDPKELIFHLVENPTGYGSIHNTFKGKRRLNRFLKEIELIYKIGFSLKDRESLKSLADVVDRITYLQKTPKSSLTSIQNTLRQRPPVNLAIAIFVVSLPIVGLSLKIFGILGLVFFIIPGALLITIFKIHRNEIRFYTDLKQQIEANKSSYSTPESEASLSE